jgi:hypothetical protein
VCVTRVHKSGVFLLLSILSILSTLFPSFHLGLYCVCPSTVLLTFRTTTLYSCFVNFIICSVKFLYFFGLGISVSFLSSLAALAVSPPFGTLALDSCPVAGVRSSHLFWRYFRPAAFDDDDYISSSILCGFLTTSDISFSLAFWIVLWVSALSSWIFTCGVSNLIHITLEIRSLLIRTTLHFIFIVTTLNWVPPWVWRREWMRPALMTVWWPHWFQCTCWWCTIQSYEVTLAFSIAVFWAAWFTLYWRQPQYCHRWTWYFVSWLGAGWVTSGAQARALCGYTLIVVPL